jgi:hypothetical protein
MTRTRAAVDNRRGSQLRITRKEREMDYERFLNVYTSFLEHLIEKWQSL